ncbi:hypothetical protein U1Q18_052368 [Sarracenia purpurea var. burkii]
MTSLSTKSHTSLFVMFLGFQPFHLISYMLTSRAKITIVLSFLMLINLRFRTNYERQFPSKVLVEMAYIQLQLLSPPAVYFLQSPRLKTSLFYFLHCLTYIGTSNNRLLLLLMLVLEFHINCGMIDLATHKILFFKMFFMFFPLLVSLLEIRIQSFVNTVFMVKYVNGHLCFLITYLLLLYN